MLNSEEGTFMCDHFPDDGEAARTCRCGLLWERPAAEALVDEPERAIRMVKTIDGVFRADPAAGPAAVLRALHDAGIPVSCLYCGRCVSLRHFEGRCLAVRKLRRGHEAKRSREDRMRERGFRRSEQQAAILNPLVPTKKEKNAAKRRRRARR